MARIVKSGVDDDEEQLPVHVVGDVSRGAGLEGQVAPVRQHRWDRVERLKIHLFSCNLKFFQD